MAPSLTPAKPGTAGLGWTSLARVPDVSCHASSLRALRASSTTPPPGKDDRKLMPRLPDTVPCTPVFC